MDFVRFACGMHLVVLLFCSTLACNRRETAAEKPAASAAVLATTEVPPVASTTSAPVASANGTAAPTSAAATNLADDPKASFLDNRLRNARAGKAELVSLRVWHCGPSCTCPQPCIETVSDETGMKWIDLVDADGKPVALADWANADVVGRFTGRTRKAKGPSPEEHVLPELRLVGAKTMLATAMAPELDGAHAKVLLSGPEAARSVQLVTDNLPYLVVAGTIALGGERVDADAQKLLKKVQDAGFPDAERQDSRAFSGLACCYEVIVAGRFADAKGADKRKAALAAKGIQAYVKKGF